MVTIRDDRETILFKYDRMMMMIDNKYQVTDRRNVSSNELKNNDLFYKEINVYLQICLLLIFRWLVPSFACVQRTTEREENVGRVFKIRDTFRAAIAQILHNKTSKKSKSTTLKMTHTFAQRV